MVAQKSDFCLSDYPKQNGPPVDLVYLSSLTMGDAALESEVLGLFAVQLPIYLNSLQNCQNSADKQVVLHTIKGAARSVGAHHLSEIAKEMEVNSTLQVALLLDEAERVADFIKNISD